LPRHVAEESAKPPDTAALVFVETMREKKK
jgi:hypothetical protein